MTSISDICKRYAERVHNPALKVRRSASSNVYVQGDSIYSYGRHFEMGRVVRDASGDATCVVLNGDRYSVSTSRHQNDLRYAIRNSDVQVPVIVVPFTALRAARIDIDSIVPLDVRADGYEYTLQTAAEPPKGAELTGALNAHWGEGSDFHKLQAAWVADGTMEWRDYINTLPLVLTVPAPERGNERQQVRLAPDGRYQWHTVRHWLGDAVFSARIMGSKKRVKWLSSFDRNEPRPLYFLCQLPACTATTYEEAIEALKPESVQLAEAMGRTVERQGDIFAIPMPGMTLADLKGRGGQIVRRSDTRKGMLARARAERQLERFVQAEDVRFRTPEYIVYREQLKGAVFGNLPWGVRQPDPLEGPRWGRRTPVQVQARERADAVSQHRRDKWQPILRERVLAAMEAAVDPSGISLLGTSHTATHVVTMPDGSQYVRGTMYHDPALMGENRERDHVRCKLGDGKTWYLIAKNTVPVAKQPRQERTAA